MTLPKSALSHDRLCEEILIQTRQLRDLARGADLGLRVPSCPDWNLAQLLRHVGNAHRWAETIVRTRATEPVPEDVNDVAGYAAADPAELDAWVAEGAALLAGALREAGPDAVVWTVVDDEDEVSPTFWARRMAYETAVHRADAALAVGAAYTLAEDVARDAVDEWMTYAALPEAYEDRPDLPGLLGPGRTLRFRATDTDEEWGVDLTGAAPAWHRGPAGEGAGAAVTVRAPLTDLLLLLYRRPARGDAPRVDGDTALLDLWLRRAGFWLQ
ncbi:hypothetical protein C3486_25295 [Streptomyces sp. Ru73]|uniref:maleylpyruvate isomerase N-terminal domain-containing protein n=1 Tax=Streptomyces sp. Ru73 TaxID=2080748 RepID=UPI000CDD1BA8|nr:maleylpyruvate isomerase N-terminal domain-containing protein [Streptomyces sp. Ru73]POX38025.1 hypothetical protein C3486_25295 [Streptomyces sp. Ru73]